VRRAALLAAAALGAVALALAGCGMPSKDLFVVERSGEGPGADLKLLVSDDGSVRCNGEKPKDMGSARLIDARGIEHDLVDQANKRRTFKPGPDFVLRYTVRLEDGTIEFSDTSRALPQVLLELAAFTREVSKQVCGLPR
jgi:hypothetical protein